MAFLLAVGSFWRLSFRMTSCKKPFRTSQAVRSVAFSFCIWSRSATALAACTNWEMGIGLWTSRTCYFCSGVRENGGSSFLRTLAGWLSCSMARSISVST